MFDWKKAFDSIDHAFRRLGIPENVLRVITSLYECHRLQSGHAWHGRSGTRRECPFSPYIFIIVLSVISHDVDQAMPSNGVPGNAWSTGHPIFDLKYADDTLLLSLTTPQLQSTLRFIETESSLYGMSLTNTKTELLNHPDHPAAPLYFLDSSRVPVVDQVKHLGSQVSWLKPFGIAFFHRASIAKTTYKKRRLIWNSFLTKQAKLRIFQSTFRSTLIYLPTDHSAAKKNRHILSQISKKGYRLQGILLFQGPPSLGRDRLAIQNSLHTT